VRVEEFHNFVNQDSELFRILKHLPKLEEKGPWLAGGSVWKAIENIPLDCDIDFFFKDISQYEEYARKFKSIPYVYHIVTEKQNKYNITFGFHICERGYNKTIPVQLISFRLCNSIEELLSGFDFTVCQFGFDGQRLYTGDTAFDDLKNRAIRFNDVRDTTATAFHLKKYLAKGFKIPFDQQKRFDELMLNVAKNSKLSPKEIMSEDYHYPRPVPEPISVDSGRCTHVDDFVIPPQEPATVGINGGFVYSNYINANVTTNPITPIFVVEETETLMDNTISTPTSSI
jgi:hypothetical protein